MKRCVSCFGEFEDVFEVCPHCGSSVGCPAAREDRIPPGTVLKQRYFIGFAAGAGGFGVLYRAYDTVLRKTVAVKEYLPSGSAARDRDGLTVLPKDPRCETAFLNGKKQFLNEARFLSGYAGERGIPEVFDYFEENGTAYIVMEYLYGRTLAADSAEKPQDPALAVFAVAEAARVTARLHKNGIVHRDIAPDNLFLCAKGDEARVVLLDFGAAERPGTKGQNGERILKNGYSAPELYVGEPADRTSDVYSLGCTLFALLTGIRPLRADIRARENQPLSVARCDVSVPRKLQSVVDKATRLQRKKRYADASAFLRALARASDAALIPAKSAYTGDREKLPERFAEPTEPVRDVTETRGVSEPVPDRLLPGTVLQGRYSVGLGVRRCGVLYRYTAHDTLLHCSVLLSEYFPPELAYRDYDGVRVSPSGTDGAFSDGLAVFRKNAEQYVSGMLPEVSESYTDLFEENGTVYLISQAVREIPLSDCKKYREGKKYSEKEVRKLLRPIAGMLTEAGKTGGLLHGNISPETVCTDGKKSRLRDPRPVCFPEVYANLPLAAEEKRPWRAPELSAGKKKADVQSECYSLGALAYRLLCGEEPPCAGERLALQVRAGKDSLIPTDRLCRCSGRLSAAIDAALTLIPGNRDRLLRELLRP